MLPRVAAEQAREELAEIAAELAELARAQQLVQGEHAAGAFAVRRRDQRRQRGLPAGARRGQQREGEQRGEFHESPAPPRGRAPFQRASRARSSAAPVADRPPPAPRGSPETTPSRHPEPPRPAAVQVDASVEAAARRAHDESAATSATEGEMWRWWAPGQSRHLQPLTRDAAATPPLRRDAAAYVFRHIGSERGVQWAILTLQDSPDFAAQARLVSEHFEIQAADDAQVELDIQREVWRAAQAPRWFAAAERRRAAARAARAFAAQSRRSRAPRQSGQRADPPRAPALGAASPATDAEVAVAAGASAQETSDALVALPAAAPRAPPIPQEPPARRPALGPARRGLPWAR